MKYNYSPSSSNKFDGGLNYELVTSWHLSLAPLHTFYSINLNFAKGRH